MHPNLNVATAFVAGLLSFVSPCTLPLIPSYLAFITGTSLEELKAEERAGARARVFLHALSFVLGFSAVFIIVFGLSAAALGALFASNKDLIARVAGVFIVILGLNMMGVLRIPFLAMDKRMRFEGANRSFVSSFLVGIGFAAGWSPCIGPFLATTIALASQEANIGRSVLLLTFFSLGLGIPFLITAAAIGSSLGVMNKIKRYLQPIEIGSGALLIATGLVAIFGWFSKVASFFSQFIPTPSL